MTRPEKVVWTATALALAAVVILALWARRPETAPPAPRAEEPVQIAGEAAESTSGLLPGPGAAIGDFPGVASSGRAMRTSELLGRFAVVDFVFTNCGGPCPMMTDRMARLQPALRGADDVRLVSFTVDPERDTPEVLAKYAADHGADPARWIFVRCERPVLVQVAYDRLRMVKDPNSVVLHSQKFALLDRLGRLRGLYDPLDDAKWMQKLLADLETLRREPS